MAVADAKHSPEPWAWKPCETDIEPDGTEIEITPADLRDGNDKSVFTVDMHEYLGLSDANARRIVACVNACEGVPTEALESGVVRELVEALEAIADEQKVYKGHGDYDILPSLTAEVAQVVARRVLAKVRGGDEA